MQNTLSSKFIKAKKLTHSFWKNQNNFENSKIFFKKYNQHSFIRCLLLLKRNNLGLIKLFELNTTLKPPKKFAEFFFFDFLSKRQNIIFLLNIIWIFFCLFQSFFLKLNIWFKASIRVLIKSWINQCKNNRIIF